MAVNARTRRRAEQLREELARHSYLYHALDSPAISDARSRSTSQTPATEVPTFTAASAWRRAI